MPSLRPHRLIALAATLAAFALAGPAVTPAAAATRGCPNANLVPSARGASLGAVRNATLCLLNRQRRAHGLRPLRASRTLGRAAVGLSHAMVVRRFFSHFAPWPGGDMVSRLKRAGYVVPGLSWTAGENIAWGEGYLASARSTVNGWMHSPGHRANILNRTFREIGLGVAAGVPVGGRGATYTTDFGKRW